MYCKNLTDAIGHTPLIELHNFGPKKGDYLIAGIGNGGDLVL